MTRTNLALDGVDDLDNDDRIRVLGIIDRFRELGINEDISLPQLVVVGDQSSGKSSLLEGLTGLSFPIASELCTRFSTQIVLRRGAADESGAKVSIIPGPSANNNEEERERLQKFERTIEGSELSAEQFKILLNDAAVQMGLPASGETNLEDLPKRFSDAVLRIELCGPDHHHLSVVDVPGLFHNPTKYQTQEDLNIIRGLLESYVTDRRTIILAVMDARNNLANQEVFRMARAADPEGLRTVGIITKCDAIQPGDESTVLSIAQNKIETLTHGWFAVKNRSTQEIQKGVTIQQRHENEKKFFNTDPWSALSRDRVGIASLKKFLGRILYDHIRGEFPGLVQEIRNLVVECRDALSSLGPPRQSTLQQRQFLSRLAAKYEHTVYGSLRGDYDSTWESDDPRRLRMHCQNLNQQFSEKIIRSGHTRSFYNSDGSKDEHKKQSSIYKHAGDIYDWIRLQYRVSRGSELPGTVNPSLLENMFREQAKKWRSITNEHIDQIEKHVKDFNLKLFEQLVTEADVRKKIASRNSNSATSASKLAKEQFDQIWADEMKGILQTVNHYFADNLSTTRQDRVVQRLKGLGLQDQAVANYHNLSQVTATVHLSNEDQAVFDIHDTLKAYYKVASKRFCDNIVMQVVERCYLGEGGPVKFLSPEYIGTLADNDLFDIAAENYATSSSRNDLNMKLNRLEHALSIAEKEQF